MVDSHPAPGEKALLRKAKGVVDSHPPTPKGPDNPPLKAKGVVDSHPPTAKGSGAEPAPAKPALKGVVDSHPAKPVLKSLFRPLSQP